ncbi:hypothetical protein L915_20992 [Phytophthora nicotianae]|uniref:Uncharacterized protein n=1 Tax=Phytophthora nicotianae TaxID=4792 RepID=W2FP29_PHYNI|nr:hypothetical protein L915_20992 [Phytophthora nicotianae]ETL25259.1 hypothetical protein L916_20869 [Phytophthora nicotianae]
MRGYAVAAEKFLGQVWNELTNKYWSFRKSLGLSDDRAVICLHKLVLFVLTGDESLMRYCCRQGKLEL